MAYTMLYRYLSTYFLQSVWFWRYTVARRPNNWNVGYKPILIVVLHHRIPTPTGDSATFANKRNLFCLMLYIYIMEVLQGAHCPLTNLYYHHRIASGEIFSAWFIFKEWSSARAIQDSSAPSNNLPISLVLTPASLI